MTEHRQDPTIGKLEIGCLIILAVALWAFWYFLRPGIITWF